MNITNRQAAIGAVLVGLGLVMWLHLWWLVWPGALVAAGVYAYRQRRMLGRHNEAVQCALWGVGLGLLFLLHFVWPGVLLLAGASFLLRGREAAVTATVQQMVLARQHRAPASQVPITSQQIPVTHIPVADEVDVPNTGDTRRL